MPQVGFGQSNPSPQYGGVPNQNAFLNANPAANLYSRFGAPSDGAPSPLPGGAPTSLGIPFSGQPTRTPTSGYNQPAPPMVGFEPWLGGGNYGGPSGGFGGPNPMAFRRANPRADLMNRFGGGMNYLPYMPMNYGMGYQNALAAQPNYNFLAPR